MAQAAGIAHLSKGAVEEGAGVDGAPMLLAVEQWRATRGPRAGDRALAEATIIYRFGSLARAECRIEVDREEVAGACLVVAEGGSA